MSVRHLIVNDSENSYIYLMKFLGAHYGKREMESFTDEQMKKLIDCLVMFESIDPNKTVREFVDCAMKHGCEDCPSE